VLAERDADRSCPNFRAEGNLGRLRYTQAKMMLPNTPIRTSLSDPAPRNTVDVQATMGKQIAVIELETQMECMFQRMRP
jgi:hypothetical protein